MLELKFKAARCGAETLLITHKKDTIGSEYFVKVKIMP